MLKYTAIPLIYMFCCRFTASIAAQGPALPRHSKSLHTMSWATAPCSRRPETSLLRRLATRLISHGRPTGTENNDDDETIGTWIVFNRFSFSLAAVAVFVCLALFLVL